MNAAVIDTLKFADHLKKAGSSRARPRGWPAPSATSWPSAW